MINYKKSILFLWSVCIICLLSAYDSFSQNAESLEIKDNYFKKITAKSGRLSERIKKTNQHYLKKYFKAENKFFKKLCKKNPVLADKLFSTSADPLFYNQKNINSPNLKQVKAPKEYFAQFDTVKSSVDFLKDHQIHLKGDGNNQLDNAESKVTELDQNLSQSDKLQQYFRQRKLKLKEAVAQDPGFKNDFKKIDEINYYHLQQTGEYKNLFKMDKSGAEKLATEALQKNVDFNKYINYKGQLSEFSKSPDDKQMLAKGFQTISETDKFMQDDIKKLGDNAKEIIEDNLKPMTETMGKMKSGKFSSATNAADVPDFTPNPLKTKRFIDRIEYGMNLQFSNVNYLFPASANIAFQIAYKVTVRSSAGIGASYDLGLGKRWDNTKISNEGFGLRSFLDYKLKGLLFLQGGYEKNYIATLPVLPHPPREIKGLKEATPDRWTSSALLGLKLKYKINKKSYGTTSLMYDFLHEKNSPYTPAFVYRVGWEW